MVQSDQGDLVLEPILIKNWSLEHATTSLFEIESCEECSIEISKVNLLIGQNSSGKSRFLRELFTNGPKSIVPNSSEFSEFSNLTFELRESLNKVLAGGATHLGMLHRVGQEFNPIERVGLGDRYWATVDFVLDEMREQAPNPKSTHGVSCLPGDQTKIESAKGNLGKLWERFAPQFGRLRSAFPEVFEVVKVYLPILRGLRPLDKKDDVYRSRTLKDLFPEKSSESIFTGYNLYDEIKGRLLGNHSQRRSVREFEEFVSRGFFGHQPVALIPRHNTDVLFVKVGNEKERPIYELGDGIQQLIIMTFPIFANRGTNLLLFIEEPEICCHPGLQRQLIETLIEEPHVQAFIATHSNHLLDLTLDADQIAVFRFSKSVPDSNSDEVDAKFRITASANDDRELLEELGARPSSLFLANCTVWVEGITDRLYLRHFLDLFRRQHDAVDLYEDKHFAFVEYAGDNLGHWDFGEGEDDTIMAKRVCSQMFVVADCDNGKDKKHERLAEILGDRYCVLPTIEIENLLTPTAIRSVISSYEGADTKVNDFEQADYRETRLGSFIEDKVLIDKIASKRLRPSSKSLDPHPWADESGTVKAKLQFARRAIDSMTSLDALSDDAKKLTERIVAFVRSQNR